MNSKIVLDISVNGAYINLINAPSPLTPGSKLLGRPVNPDLYIPWKITLPATLAGRVEHLLMDPITRKPKYGSRNKIIIAALEEWVQKQGIQVDG